MRILGWVLLIVVRFGWLGSARILVYGIWPDFPADS
jgi:hypothetical protein